MSSKGSIKDAFPSVIRDKLPEEEKLWKKHILEDLEKNYLTGERWRLSSSCYLLMRFLDMNFTLELEEKARVIQILYDCLTQPGIGRSAQKVMCKLCCRLIKSKEVLPLTVPWRPLFNILRNLLEGRNRDPEHESTRWDTNCWDLARKIRRYFPQGSVQEILAEVRSCVWPFNQTFASYITLLSISSSSSTDQPSTTMDSDQTAVTAPSPLQPFPPTTDLSWVDEVFAILQWMQTQRGEAILFSFILGLLREPGHPGLYDWEPYLGYIFTRVMMTLGLPPSESDANGAGGSSGGAGGSGISDLFEGGETLAGCTLVQLVTPFNSAFAHLEKLLQTLHPYFHPSNDGYWTIPLGRFLLSLCVEFSDRALLENPDLQHSRQKPTHQPTPTAGGGDSVEGEWEDVCITPKTHRMTQEHRTKFVEMMFPLISMALYSKNPTKVACAASSLKYLGLVEPALVFSLLMPRVPEALGSVTESHQTKAVLVALEHVIPLLLHRDHYSEGASHLATILELTVQGIDINDMPKTSSVLRLYESILMRVPLYAYEFAPYGETNEMPPLPFEALEDWAFSFLTRILALIGDYVPSSDADSAKWATEISRVLSPFFAQCSPELHARALSMVRDFLVSHTSPHATKAMALMCSASCGSDPALAVSMLLPVCYEKMVDESKGTPTLHHLTETELIWWISATSGLIASAGCAVTEQHSARIRTLLSVLWSPECDRVGPKASKFAAKLFKRVVASLIQSTSLDFRSFSDQEAETEVFKKAHWMLWGRMMEPKETDFKFFNPTRATISFAVSLLNERLPECMGVIRDYIAHVDSKPKGSTTAATTDSPMVTDGVLPKPAPTKQALVKQMKMFNMCVRPLCVLLPEISDAPKVLADHERVVDKERFPLYLRWQDAQTDFSDVLSQLVVTRSQLCELMHSLLSCFLRSGAAEPKVLTLAIKTTDALMCIRNKNREKIAGAWKRRTPSSLRSGLFHKKRDIRMKIKQRLFEQISVRNLSFWDTAHFTSPYSTLLTDLLDISLSRQLPASSRQRAQLAFFSCCNSFGGRVVEHFLPRIIGTLDISNNSDEILGALDLLQNQYTMACISEDWPLTHQLIHTMCRTGRLDSVVERQIDEPSVEERLQEIVDLFLDEFHILPFGESIYHAMDKSNPVKEPPALGNSAIPNTHSSAESPRGQKRAREDGEAETQSNPTCATTTTTTTLIEPSTTNDSNSNITTKRAKTEEEPTTHSGSTHEILSIEIEIQKNSQLPTFESIYFDIIRSCVEAFKTSQHWTYQCRSTTFLQYMLRNDALMPLSACEIFAQSLNSKTPTLRAMAAACIPCVLLQYKPVKPREMRSSKVARITYEEAAKMGDPKTEKEWNEFQFRELIYNGWYRSPLVEKVYLQDKPLVFSPETTAFATMLRGLLCQGDFVGSMINILVDNKQDEEVQDLVDVEAVHFFKGFFQIFQHEMLEILKPHLETLLTRASAQQHDQRACIAVTAEIVAGLIRGSRHWEFKEIEEAWKYVVGFLRRNLNLCTIESCDDWAEAMGIALKDLDCHRVHWIKDLILSIPSETSETIPILMSLELAKTSARYFGWKDLEFNRKVVFAFFEKCVHHPSDFVRESIAQLISVTENNAWVPFSEGEGEMEPKFVFKGQKGISEMKGFYVEALEKLKSQAAPATEGSFSAEDSSCPHKQAAGVCARLTFTSVMHSPWSSTYAICSMLPTILLLSASNDRELADLGADCWSTTVSETGYTAAEFSEIFKVVSKTMSGSPTRKLKLSCLSLLKMFLSRHLFYFFEAPRPILDTLLPLLKDSQIEVRELVAEILSGFFRLLPTSEIESLQAMFLEWAGPTKGKTLPADIPTAHGGVLGLSSIIMSFPYDVPDFLPKTTSIFIGYQAKPSPIKDTVRKTIGQFWRTHGDMWHLHKEKFTKEQVDDLKDITSSTSYYV